MGLMQIPRRVDYGLRAVIYLSDQEPQKCCSIAEIARRQGVPRKFLEKIIQDLIRSGLIKSKRGSLGGYMLARPADAISFYDVIEAIEGPIYLNICLMAEGECSRDKTCPAHAIWDEAQGKMMDVLSRANFADLAKAERELQVSNV